jgi:hypothetical protein
MNDQNVIWKTVPSSIMPSENGWRGYIVHVLEEPSNASLACRTNPACQWCPHIYTNHHVDHTYNLTKLIPNGFHGLSNYYFFIAPNRNPFHHMTCSPGIKRFGDMPYKGQADTIILPWPLSPGRDRSLNRHARICRCRPRGTSPQRTSPIRPPGFSGSCADWVLIWLCSATQLHASLDQFPCLPRVPIVSDGVAVVWCVAVWWFLWSVHRTSNR